jgi:hypothetical protein
MTITGGGGRAFRYETVEVWGGGGHDGADESYIIFCQPKQADVNCISSFVGFSKHHQKLIWLMEIHCFPVVATRS